MLVAMLWADFSRWLRRVRLGARLAELEGGANTAHFRKFVRPTGAGDIRLIGFRVIFPRRGVWLESGTGPFSRR